MNFKIVSIFVILLSLAFLGCVEPEPVGTPVPTATPTAAPTAAPTVIPTTVQPTPTPTVTRTPKFYISDVDDVYGFRKVTVLNGTADYTNRTLTINASDTIRWRSLSETYSLTIVSRENLWDNSSSRLRYVLSYFNYTFTEPGSYEVYIKEFPKTAPQKIIVNP